MRPCWYVASHGEITHRACVRLSITALGLTLSQVESHLQDGVCEG